MNCGHVMSLDASLADSHATGELPVVLPDWMRPSYLLRVCFDGETPDTNHISTSDLHQDAGISALPSTYLDGKSGGATFKSLLSAYPQSRVATESADLGGGRGGKRACTTCSGTLTSTR